MNVVQALFGTRIRKPRALSREELRALWSFRLEQINLRSDISEEEDFEAFVRDFDVDGRVWYLLERGKPVGMYLQAVRLVEHEGRRLVVGAPDYVFMARHLRRHPALAFGVAWLTIWPMLRHPFRHPIMTGGVYPSSYIGWRRMVERCFSLGDPALSSSERALVARLGPLIWGEAWVGDGTLRFRTIPEASRPRSPLGLQLFEAYESMNPEWRTGRALFFVSPMGVGDVAIGLQRALFSKRRTAGGRLATAEAPARPSGS